MKREVLKAHKPAGVLLPLIAIVAGAGALGMWASAMLF